MRFSRFFIDRPVFAAVADLAGTLHAAEPRFPELVRMEWPDWQGPLLPAVLRWQIAFRLASICRLGQH